ncbi:MAG: glycerol-3-phosphate dehydrogenase/oxidase [Cellulomonadaceae bacterium]|jgi:glycerol-3-phosphate dehydrogenase|nr:glycerol-3-phosphate dehydrogenase/oxidase [Cellulomonadaceae bacterium]
MAIPDLTTSQLTSALTTHSRSLALERLRRSTEPGNELDILVIGGGVTGAGIALDAATRGLDTAVVEAQDWSAGTSSRSSKLVHGGLRYLQMLDFNLVYEALTERDLLLKYIAPHLVKPVPFLFPMEHRIWHRGFIGSGIALYDALATISPGKRAVPWHKHYFRFQLDRDFPDLSDSAAMGAIQYWDATVDDARLVMTIIRTAQEYGAAAASRVQVAELHEDDGTVNGATVIDQETGERIAVAAKRVIIATGVWTEETEALAGGGGGIEVLASKGIHIVVPRDCIQGDKGLILQTEKSVLFIIPWSRYWIIGTTDTPWNESLRNPVPTSADIDYLLEHANSVLVHPISRDDILGTFAGLRPLLQPGTKRGTSSAKVSREHTVASPRPGLFAIAGGKLTTYRVMAKDAVDHALGAAAHNAPSVTQDIPLVGAVGLAAVKHQGEKWAAQFGWPSETLDHLLHRYGTNIKDIVALCEADPGLAKPLENAPAYLRAEIVYGVTHEGALHLEDLLLHRTRLVYEVKDSGLAALNEIAGIVAPLLHWDDEKVVAEVKAYQDLVAAYRAAITMPTDVEAQTVRDLHHEITPMNSLG